ncbi:hypothetical protein C8J27_106212 [Rhodobacter aestuarii]|uniref:Oligosaccharide repeat unit polymerase n=1 Tax=Rhodobacter aestuarii TaxID=453582 RepID=A0A1N7M9V9_9RHOB|nr:hypothetical protein [Rhodobacter aestuarii]PTV94943.1 hypothetical protein C8J27_106212 [Rhodobacter aestuarii]SIS82843.1 hypothetical protein SAMN05421580_105212 [Rhodobacter aestuarii]
MRRTLTALGFLSLFGLVAALLVVIAYGYGRRANFTGVDTLSAVFLVSVAATYCLIVLMWRKAGMMEAVNAYFFLFPIGVVSLYQCAWDRFPWWYIHTRDNMLYANMLAVAVIMLFLAGNLLGQGRPFELPSRSVANRQILFSKFTFVLSFLLLTGVNAWPRLLTPRFEKAGIPLEGISGQISYVAQDIALCAMIVLIVARRAPLHREQISKTFYYMAGFYTFLIFNPIGNIRSVFIGYALSCLCAILYGWSISGKAKGIFITVLMAGNFLLFPAVKSFGAGLAEGWGGFIKTFNKFGNNLFSADFDVPQMTANGVAYVTRFGHTPLEYIVGFFLFFIPRSIWHDKPTGTPFYIMDSLNYSFLNLSYPYYLDLWSSGGYLLTVIGVVFVGFFIMRVGESARRAEMNGTLNMSMVMYSLVAGFAPIMLRGSVNGSIAFYGIAFYWVAVTLFVSRLTIRRS